MSLMNDALRKKKLEKTGSPTVPVFPSKVKPSRAFGKWLGWLALVLLLTSASLAGVHLMQSVPASNLQLKHPLPPPSRSSRPFVSQRVSSDSGPEQSAVSDAPGDDRREPGIKAKTPQDNRSANADPLPAIPATTVESSGSGTQVATTTAAMASAGRKTATEAEAGDAAPLDAGFESASKQELTVSRAFEPGPDRSRPSIKHASVAVRQPKISPRSIHKGGGRPSEPSSSTSGGHAKVQRRPSTHQDATLFYKKALAYHRHGRLADAIGLYRQVLKSESNHLGAMQNLAAAHIQQGSYIEAQVLLERLEQAAPRPRGVLLNLAIVAIGMGNPGQALAYLNQAQAAMDAPSWEIRFHRAVALADMNRYQEALALYRQVQREQPEDPRVQFNLAVTCDAMGLYPQALTYYDGFLSRRTNTSPDDTETILKRMHTIRRYLNTTPSPAEKR